MFGDMTPQGPVAAYIRVSTEDQMERNTPERQRQALVKWAQERSIPIYDLYFDEVSGRIPLEKRPGGARLLEDAAEGSFSTVVVYSLDRFSRRLRNLLDDREKLKNLDVSIYSLSETIDTSTYVGDLVFSVIGAISQWEVDTIHARMRGGRAAKAKNGIWIQSQLPYGYMLDEQHRLIPYPPEARIVREIYERLANGETQVSIAKDLNDRGLVSTVKVQTRESHQPQIRNTFSWTHGTVSHLIRNPVYKGLYLFNGIESDYHPEPIVSPELWEVVVKPSATRPNSRATTLVSGLLICGTCGNPFYHHKARSRKRSGGYYLYDQYQCNSRRFNKNPGCNAKMLRVDEVDAYVWGIVEEWIRHPTTLQEYLREHRGEAHQAEDELEQELSALTLQLTEKGEEKQMILTLARKKVINQTDLQRQLLAINHEEQEIRSQALGIQAQLDKMRGVQEEDEEIIRILKEMNARLDQGFSFTEKRLLVRKLLQSGLVTTVGEGRSKSAEIEFIWRFDVHSIDSTPVRRGQTLGITLLSRLSLQCGHSQPRVLVPTALDNRTLDAYC